MRRLGAHIHKSKDLQVDQAQLVLDLRLQLSVVHIWNDDLKVRNSLRIRPVLVKTGVRTSGYKSEMMPLKSGRSKDRNLSTAAPQSATNEDVAVRSPCIYGAMSRVSSPPLPPMVS